MQSLLGFLSAILCFFYLKEFASHLLIGCCPYRQPINNCPEEIGDKKNRNTPHFGACSTALESSKIYP